MRSCPQSKPPVLQKCPKNYFPARYCKQKLGDLFFSFPKGLWWGCLQFGQKILSSNTFCVNVPLTEDIGFTCTNVTKFATSNKLK